MQRTVKKSALILASTVSVIAIVLVFGINAYQRKWDPMLKSNFDSFVAHDFVHNDPEGTPITQFNFTGKLTLVLIPSLLCSNSCPELEQFLQEFEPWQGEKMQSKSSKNDVFQRYVASLGSPSELKSLADWQNMVVEASDKVLGQIDFDQTTTQVAILDDDARVIDVLPITEPRAIERRLSQTYSRVAMYKFLTDVPMFRRY